MSAEIIIATKYAKALLALANEEKQAERVQTDLGVVAQYFSAGDGQQLLAHPLLSVEKKFQIVTNLLAGQVSPLMLSFLKLLLEKRRGQLVGSIAAIYEQEWLEEQKRKIAVVTTAIPLSGSQLKKLQEQLGALNAQDVELQQVVDPGLRAGARVEMGDWILDGTLQARLNRLRRVLSADN